MNTEDLKELASQLRQPHGEKGLEVASMMHESNINMTLHAIQSLDLKADDQVLELGHGSCAHLEHLLAPNGHVVYYGLEVSDLMHQEAQRLNKQLIEKGQAWFMLYDGTDIPFPENSFDSIFTVNTIYFWPDPERMLAELYRVLKKDGRLCITFAQEHFMQQLPFTQFGFNLYSTSKAGALVEGTLFQTVSAITQKETVKAKSGEVMEREFTTLLLQK